MKTPILILALALTGCASFAEVPKASDPVLQGGLPLAGETLQSLAHAFTALCKKPYSAPCESARTALNAAIDSYNAVNDEIY